MWLYLHSKGTATVDDKITKIFRLPSPGINRKYSQDSPAANGPYASLTHPWTGRDDYGINCRVKNENGGYQRGDEIYYCGIIDILQQYNMSKQAEHFLKVRSFIINDTTVICTYRTNKAKWFIASSNLTLLSPLVWEVLISRHLHVCSHEPLFPPCYGFIYESLWAYLIILSLLFLRRTDYRYCLHLSY